MADINKYKKQKDWKMMRFPSHIEIEITNCCQLACRMCPNRLMVRPKGFMMMSTLDHILAEAAGITRTCYMHMIGEPLLHPQLVEMIKKVSAANIRTSISTNAILLTPATALKLYASGLDELTMALDSLRPEVYEKYRTGADFEEVVRHIDQAIEVRHLHPELNTELELQLIVMENNQADVEPFKAKYGPLLEGIGHLNIKGFSTFAGHVPDYGPGGTKPRRTTCGKLTSSIAVQWNGDLVICCRDYDSFTTVGNIHETTIERVFNSPKYAELRRALKERDFANIPFCRGC